MSSELSLKETQKEWHGSLKSYLIGFAFSVLCTTLSFAIVLSNFFTQLTTIWSITDLAILQAIIQLLFFLHVGQEAKPRWETLLFYFMVLVLVIIVLGSLWIMFDLNYRVMGDMQMSGHP